MCVVIVGVLRSGLSLVSVPRFLHAVIIWLVFVMALTAGCFEQRKT